MPSSGSIDSVSIDLTSAAGARELLVDAGKTPPMLGWGAEPKPVRVRAG